MHPHQDAFDIRKLVLDLISIGGEGHDLDDLLARLIKVLERIPLFRIEPRGVIRMYNSRGTLLCVAQLGFQPIWLAPEPDALFAAIPPYFLDAAFVAQLTPDQKAFVLPLSYDERPLGQTIILIPSDWTPTAADCEFMTRLANALSGLVSRYLMHETLQVREVELDEARAQVIRRLGTASEYRDNETGLHVLRMAHISVAVAKVMGITPHQRELLSLAAAVHDVGKIGIGDAILLKPGKLTDEEFDVMKTHTEIGEQLLQGSDSIFEAARYIALNHHENWDGSGYPGGLKGEEIPVLARICSIADVFEALISRRVYKDAWPVEQACDWIIGQAGKKFDPAVVLAFQSALPEILRIRELYRDEVINPNEVLSLPEPVGDEQRWISWDASLSVGIKVIDEHHRYLFELTNELIDAMANKGGARRFARVLRSLEEYAQVHFKAEERMMEHHGYDHTELQKQQHRRFAEKLNEFSAEFHNNPLIFPSEMVAYLREWLDKHIRHEDTRLRSLVDNT